MTVTTAPASVSVRRPGPITMAVGDSLAVAWRNLITYRRVPQLLVFSTIQPVIFVLMFRYVFGGAIKIPGGVPYVDFLMPGIFVQTVVFGAMAAAIGLATDLKTGLLERFRSLAQPDHVPAGTPAARLLHHPAGDLRADVPLRFRRRDQDPGWRSLRRLPDARHLRADRGLRSDGRRNRPGDRPQDRVAGALPISGAT